MVASKKPQQRTTVCRRRRRHHPRPFSLPRASTTGITWPPAAVEARPSVERGMGTGPLCAAAQPRLLQFDGGL